MLALITTQIQEPSFSLPEASGRCWETARKKMRNAANSRKAESGNRNLHSHRYTLAAHRNAAPVVHIAQQIHAVQKEDFAPPRIFGME